MNTFGDSVRTLLNLRRKETCGGQSKFVIEPLRDRIQNYLTILSESDRMPWDGLQQQVANIMVEQLSRVLPDAERDRFRAAFAAEMFRLRTAAAAD